MTTTCQDFTMEILKIAIPSILVIIGWGVSLWIQSKNNQKSLLARTYLDASWEIRRSINEMLDKSQPFLVDILILSRITKDAKENGKFINEIPSGWVKKYSWDEYLENMDQHLSAYGTSAIIVIDTLLKYDYLHDLDWTKFADEIKNESGKIHDETTIQTGKILTLLHGGELPEDDIIEMVAALSSRANELTDKIKKQSEYIEKAFAQKALNIKSKRKIHINKIKVQENGSLGQDLPEE